MAGNKKTEIRTLWIVLVINFLFFLIEFIFGKIHSSIGLLEDSLDMLADAVIYGLSLLALSECACRKARIAKLVAFAQSALVLYGFAEIVKRFLGYSAVPNYIAMIVVSVFALIGNSVSLILLQRLRSSDVNIKASLICSSNDVKSNAGIIMAAILVLITDSFVPDLIAGIIILYLVLKGVKEIFEETKKIENTNCDLHRKLR
ncbi:MAG: cation transporter [Rickettsiales bacterium]|jgi:Co/Zn/Cd efflux system component|nr:cation transporter [Rickettsiales bacterium]